MKDCRVFTFPLFIVPLFFLLSVSAQPARPPITGIAFVQLRVTDIKKASIFYQSLLGYRVVPVPGTGNKPLFNIRVNQRQSIQLQPGLPPGEDEKLAMLAFQTTDATAMRVYLQSKGIAVPDTVTHKANMLFFTITDPGNHTIQFVQYITSGKEQLQIKNTLPAISKRILHTGLMVTDTLTTNAFYGAILGFSEIWRGGATDSITSWINMRVPEGTDYIEYMLSNKPVSRQQLGSMHHIALMVPDMQAAVDVLNNKARSVAYPVATPRIGRNRRWQLNLFDPDGTRIELMEPFPMR